MRLNRKQMIKVGALGEKCFDEGYYAYIGSALSGLKGRINHHLKTGKKLHWHIDYLLEKATIKDIVIAKTEKKIECELAELFFSRFKTIGGFGSSDCHCASHLFFSGSRDILEKTAYGTIKSLGLNPEIRRYGGLTND